MSDNNKDISRRSFLKRLGGASAALSAAALTGCETKRNPVSGESVTALGDIPKDKMTYRTNPKTGEKVSLLAVCGKEAVARGIKAGDLVRHVSAICGGKGGGKPDSAMGGGSDPLKVDDALASVDDFVSEKLG